MPLLGALFQYPDNSYTPVPPDYNVIVDNDPTGTSVNVIKVYEKAYTTVHKDRSTAVSVQSGRSTVTVRNNGSTTASVTRLQQGT